MWNFLTLAWLDEVARHGFQGAVLSVWLLSGIVASKGGTEFSVKCTMMPLLCWGPDTAGGDQREVEIRIRKFDVVRVAFYGKGTGKKICSCHIDYQINGKPIHRVRAMEYPTCDSDLEFPHDKWEAVEDLNFCQNFSKCSYVTVSEWNGKMPRRTFKSPSGYSFTDWPYTYTELHQGDRVRWHCTSEETEP